MLQVPLADSDHFASISRKYSKHIADTNETNLHPGTSPTACRGGRLCVATRGGRFIVTRLSDVKYRPDRTRYRSLGEARRKLDAQLLRLRLPEQPPCHGDDLTLTGAKRKQTMQQFGTDREPRPSQGRRPSRPKRSPRDSQTPGSTQPRKHSRILDRTQNTTKRPATPTHLGAIEAAAVGKQPRHANSRLQRGCHIRVAHELIQDPPISGQKSGDIPRRNLPSSRHRGTGKQRFEDSSTANRASMHASTHASLLRIMWTYIQTTGSP